MFLNRYALRNSIIWKPTYTSLFSSTDMWALNDGNGIMLKMQNVTNRQEERQTDEQTVHYRYLYPNISGITNVEVRRTGMDQRDDIIQKRWLQWLGHLHCMKQGRIPKQALNRSPAGKRKRGRPRMNWTSTIKKDLESIGMTWEETERAAEDRAVWRSCVARCAGDTGRTKVRHEELKKSAHTAIVDHFVQNMYKY